MMKQRSNWSSIERVAIETLDKIWTSNEKQKKRERATGPMDNFEATAHFKGATSRFNALKSLA